MHEWGSAINKVEQEIRYLEAIRCFNVQAVFQAPDNVCVPAQSTLRARANTAEAKFDVRKRALSSECARSCNRKRTQLTMNPRLHYNPDQSYYHHRLLHSHSSTVYSCSNRITPHKHATYTAHTPLNLTHHAQSYRPLSSFKMLNECWLT